MGSVKLRVRACFAVLMLLFVALVLVQLFVGDRLQADQQRHADRIERALNANGAALQHMTDAETGIRGFQLTGQREFLEPYESGRLGAFTTLDRLAGLTGDPAAQRLLTAERQAAAHWLTAYAYPVVDAGVSDAGQVRPARGRAMFDQIRTINAQLDAALRAEQATVARADRRQAHAAQLLFGGLAAAFVAVALLLALVHQRLLLAPVEHIRLVLARLAAGERSARAVPSGPREMRAVIDTLNRLAAQTERLVDAEQARSIRNELRQAVVAELRCGLDTIETGHRIIELIGNALGADAVHGRIATEAGDRIAVSWPSDAPELSARTVADLLAGPPATVMDVPHITGAIAVQLNSDDDRPAGLLSLVRRGKPAWTADERRLLAALAHEVERAVRQQRLARRQARLISDLRVLDERKDAFVATVTHELRTPLTSILGYVEMLADGDGGELSVLQQRGVSAILRNALRLQNTVGDLLLLDRTGRTGPTGAVDLATVLAGVHAEVSPSAQAKDLILTIDVQPAWVSGDRDQLERAVRNLVDNAIKFTAAGGRVSCHLGAEGDGAVLTIADSGIGIPDEDVPRVFVPFHRAANAMQQAIQGSGLGLAIVHDIVSEHGGAVTARSVVDEGSSFTVTLPLAAPPPPSAESRTKEVVH